MATHYFKFSFPSDLKALPKPCRYEVLPGNVGIIETEDERLSTDLTHLWTKRTGQIEKTTSDVIQALIGKTKTIDQIERVPSFTKQTKWPSGFFSLPETPGTCFFNPGLEWWDGSLHLFTRRCQYSHQFGRRTEDNDLAIFRLNPDLSPASCIIPEPPRRHTREQWEDPRAFVVDGKCYVSMATLVRGIGWKIRQCLVEMSDDLSKFTVVSEPEFGGNHSTPSMAKGHEKNWTWFQRDGERYCVYQLNPLVIFLDTKSTDKWVSTNTSDSIPWEHGTLRGGTNPELIDGEYLTFFHSSLPWKDAFGHAVMGTRRRYYMGALTFTAEPPFRITAMTPKPLLIGSEEDPRTLEGPPVVFPCGAKIIDGSWLVTMGINDERCGWISIPHEELKAKMVKV